MIITLQTLIFFRESLLNVFDQWLRPYYKKFSLTFGRSDEGSEDEESDEHVFSDFDEERGVVFYPPMYLQRYAAVSDCLLDERWSGKIEKVVDLGYHDMSFIKYLKEVQGIKSILGVDIESIPLRCCFDIIGCDDYVPKRENPLEITLFKGNAADPDYRLIGCDAVIAIEMIEHMLPHDLDRLIHTVFGFIKPQIAVFTTPNGDFNVLFKAMEKNGLRRLDHFFEWSREQFHDWCSNIVGRYPQYTVSCKGIGPGPSGTKHLGCCSQMALFIAKDYNKQPDLNLNSLALVPDTPSPNSISNLISSWESIPNEILMIEPPQNAESYSELEHSEKQSSITLDLTTSSMSNDPIPYKEKASQCNLDAETGKNYLMFDYEQMCFDVLVPTNKMVNRVYEMEDVSSRLNCTTLQVDKFSKTTQNLIAKNKLDTLVHTREVVDEIRHLTKMLNFNKECNNQLENGTHTWCNINWGENAPYWNQYYHTVKEYTYPFQTKSEEARILDLISDEINRLIDAQFDVDLREVEADKLQIPIESLMKVVQHITDDVEKVKDLLEWNGYEVVDDMVIHSRLVVDCSSVGTQEYDSQDTDVYYSDWDSIDIRSTSMSDGSNLVPDHYARCLRRALDQKVRKLRSVLIADEDITTELDLVVCRLMKLALHTSRDRIEKATPNSGQPPYKRKIDHWNIGLHLHWRNAPPPTRWMQSKLLDLLTLTEKTIERRKKYFIENYPLKAINCDEKSEEMTALEKIKEDNTASKIVDKYQHLVKQPYGMEGPRAMYRLEDLELDDLSVSSADFGKNYDYVDRQWAHSFRLEPALPDANLFDQNKDNPQGELKLKRTQAWVEEDIEVVPYPSHDAKFENSSVGTDDNTANVTINDKKRYKAKKCIELNCVVCKKSHSKGYKQKRSEEIIKENAGKTKYIKKVSRQKSSNSSIGLHTNNKYVSVDLKTYKVKPRRKYHKSLYPTASKPVPASLIDINQPELMIGNDVGLTGVKSGKFMMSEQVKPEVAAIKESLLIDIITEDTQETISLRRTIGTDFVDPMAFEDETLIRSVSNTLMNEDNLFEKHKVATGNIHSQTIFLYDIDEPTTSKGIRHTSMDVQCGPDAIVPTYSMLSATTSLTRITKIFSTGIKIGNSTTDTNIKNTECSTCTNDADNTNSFKTILPREKPIGIHIKDSYSNLKEMEISTMPAYSILSATTSLTRMPDMFTVGFKIGDSINDTNIKCTDCNTCTKDACYVSYRTVLPREQCIDINTKDSYSNIIKQINLSSVPIYSMLPATRSLTRMSKTFTAEAKMRDFTIDTKIKNSNRETCTNEGEKTTKSVLPREKSIEIKIKDFKMDFSTMPAYSVSSATISLTRIAQQKECTTNTQEYIDKLNTSSPKPLAKTRTLLKSKSKERSTSFFASFKVKDSRTNLPKKTECYRNTQLHYERSKFSSQRPLSKETRLLKSLTKHKSVDFKIKDSALLANNIECSTNTPKTDDKTNASSPLLNETTFQKLPSDVKTVESASEFFVSVDSFVHNSTQRGKSLQNSDLQIISAVNKLVLVPGQQSCNYVKTKLCNGGVQVHSYRDKSISEDIIFQGEWQKNRPKVVTKKKMFIPVVSKKGYDSSLKRKIRSKEKILSKNSAKWDYKPETRALPQRKLVNLKQESNKNEVKLNRKVPFTVATAKPKIPFRNVLKVPSKFTLSSVPLKKPKSACIVKKAPINPNLAVTKDDVTPRKITNKSTIPWYLRKKPLKFASDINQKDLNLSSDSAKCIKQIYKSDNKSSKENATKTLIRSKTEEIKRNSLKFHTSTPIPQYVVLRNEIEQNKSGTNEQQTKTISDTAKKRKNAPRQRSVIFNTSPNSSSCSSPCSVDTVRAVPRPKNVISQRHSISSHKNNSVTKRFKSSKMTADKVSEKNTPQTFKQLNIAKKGSDKFGKGPFMGQKKDVYIAHVEGSPSLELTVSTLSKHKTQKSNVNIPNTDNISQKRSLHIRSPSPSEKESSKCDTPLPANEKNDVPETSQTSNMVLVIEPQARGIQSLTCIPKSDTVNVLNNRLVTNWIDNSEGSVKSQTSNIMSAMKELIDETLDFIDDPLDRCIIDSETVILSRENLRSRNGSASSFKTTISNNENANDILQRDIEFALNLSFDTSLGNESILSLEDTRLTVTDFDVLSFKSITSTPKISDYLCAEELSSSYKIDVSAQNETPVRDIFERRDQPFQPAQIQHNTPRALALQAFSGFSISGDPVPGDQPDYVNFIDSETGSLALDVARQATSEELLISGRSSESYQSCLMDEDAVVPNWLFQIISQQQSAMDESEPQAELPPLEVADPMYDDNGNMVEGPVAGAGAGDGHGIHSDQSQDSSGRGTSVSSSDTSSGQQSEAILVDPSSFVAQFEQLRNAVETSVVLAINETAETNAMASRQAPNEVDSQSFSCGESRWTPRLRPATASDVDADVSSLETDADGHEDSDN